MNDDLRLQRYLSAQADTITLGPADPADVVRRGNRRRNRRRGALVGAVAVLAVGATSVAVYDSGDATVVSDLAHAEASTFDWAEVIPERGLAFSPSQVELGNGAVYGLSSAPASVTGQDAFDQRLYRSDDEAEWAEVTMPVGVTPSSLAAAGDTLYAVGTAPAGGGTRDLVVASSTDGARTWANVTLPREIADLESRYPGQIRIGGLSLAARDATHLVAGVSVSASIDPRDHIADLPEDAGWEITTTGISVYDPPEPESCDDLPEVEARCAGTADPSGRAGSERGTLVAEYTWDQLGVPAELQAYIAGRSLLYVSDDGETFTQASLPGDPSGWGGPVLATADGYRAFVAGSGAEDPTTKVFRSIDGHTWTEDGVLAGSAMTAGLVGDRPAVALSTLTTTVVSVQQADGAWVPLDLAGAVEAPGDGEVWLGSVAFGPLGVAADVTVVDDPERGGGVQHIVHSDGATIYVHGIDAGHGGSVAGITVSADAITVRVMEPTDDDPATPPTQTLLVGTPAG